MRSPALAASGMAPTSYRALLRKRSVATLLAASLAARFPLGFYPLAVLLWARSATGSFALAGATTAAFSLSRAIASPVQGALVDRFGQPKILFPAALGQLCAMTAAWFMAKIGPSAAIVGLTAIAGALVPPLPGCVRALWPSVCGDPASTRLAYALDAVSQETIWILGPLLLAVVIAIGSTSAGLLVAVAGTMLGTYGFTRIPAARAWRPLRGNVD
jgi:MFS family permease